MRLHYIQDSGHGWIVAPVSLVRDLGIADRISRYSYHDSTAGQLYLEEDCDAPAFIRALRVSGIEPDIIDVHVNGDAKCRALPSWRA